MTRKPELERLAQADLLLATARLFAAPGGDARSELNEVAANFRLLGSGPDWRTSTGWPRGSKTSPTRTTRRNARRNTTGCFSVM
ncbi:MAG: hypothetical protein M5R36_01205 [Deltaproteobacteria bacterium]|nr:hypothetical protein [Deltaproteobacteria bacterium]